RTQCEEPLFDFLELMRLEFELARGRLERGERLGCFRGGTLGSRPCRVAAPLGAFAGTFQTAGRAGERGLRARAAVEFADRLGQTWGQPLGALQQRAPGGEA